MKRERRHKTLILVTVPLIVASAIILYDRVSAERPSQQGFELVTLSVVDAKSGDRIHGAVLRSSDNANQLEPRNTDSNGKLAFMHSYEYEHVTYLLCDKRNSSLATPN